MRAAGVDVQVSIVSFAISDQGLRESFQEWADLGGGAYFDADDPAALSSAMQAAIRQSFEVTASDGRVVARGVAGGDAIELTPGAYTVKSGSKSQTVTIQAGRGATVTLE